MKKSTIVTQTVINGAQKNAHRGKSQQTATSCPKRVKTQIKVSQSIYWSAIEYWILDSQNGFGQGFEPKKPHSGYNPFEHQPRPFNSTDSGQLGQQLETAEPNVNQNEKPTTAVPKTLPRKKGNKGKNGRSKCRPFAGRVPNCNWNGGSPHGPGPMKVPNGDKNG